MTMCIVQLLLYCGETHQVSSPHSAEIGLASIAQGKDTEQAQALS